MFCFAICGCFLRFVLLYIVILDVFCDFLCFVYCCCVFYFTFVCCVFLYIFFLIFFSVFHDLLLCFVGMWLCFISVMFANLFIYYGLSAILEITLIPARS